MSNNNLYTLELISVPLLLKIAILNEQNEVLFSTLWASFANIQEDSFQFARTCNLTRTHPRITGHYRFRRTDTCKTLETPFVRKSLQYLLHFKICSTGRRRNPELGGEDAKSSISKAVMWNGICAGGTGSFDQMASLLQTDAAVWIEYARTTEALYTLLLLHVGVFAQIWYSANWSTKGLPRRFVRLYFSRLFRSDDQWTRLRSQSAGMSLWEDLFTSFLNCGRRLSNIEGSRW